MNSIVEQAIDSVQKSKNAFSKFISPNDCGKTGGHQSGFYIPKSSIALAFDVPGKKGENKDRFVSIKWQGDFETISRFIYYGVGTRNEYRLTNFGKGFPFLTDDNVGDLFILSHIDTEYYEAFVLQSDEDIEEFFAAFNISSSETNKLINKQNIPNAEDKLINCFNLYINTLNKRFPSTIDLSNNARSCYNSCYNVTDKKVKLAPDNNILSWIESEYQLFKAIESKVYEDTIKTPIKNIEELVILANTILNRRKSRAGKSLEYHLANVFNIFDINYTAQGITEDNKKPDFIFPNIKAYHDRSYNPDNLIFLASKTTCKDRWRQVINEADRIEIKYLFTLQQGISKNQLYEMYKEGVRLVVPKNYLKSFPEEYIPKILSLESFVNFASSKQQ